MFIHSIIFKVFTRFRYKINLLEFYDLNEDYLNENNEFY